MKKLFKYLDRNSSGSVTLKEFQKVFKLKKDRGKAGDDNEISDIDSEELDAYREWSSIFKKMNEELFNLDHHPDKIFLKHVENGRIHSKKLA